MSHSNKYYTPNIEDLFVGYECEMEVDWEYATEICATKDQIEEMWINYKEYPNAHKLTIRPHHILEYFDFINTNISYPIGRIRTKYLDKYDIESEGWIDLGKGHTFSKAGTEKLVQITPNCELRIFTKGGSEGSFKREYFVGFCPSLNEFRKIGKLLGI